MTPYFFRQRVTSSCEGPGCRHLRTWRLVRLIGVCTRHGQTAARLSAACPAPCFRRSPFLAGIVQRLTARTPLTSLSTTRSVQAGLTTDQKAGGSSPPGRTTCGNAFLAWTHSVPGPPRLEALDQVLQAMSVAARFSSYFFAVASSFPRYMRMPSRASSASSVRPVSWSSFQWRNKMVRSTSSWWIRRS